MKTFADAIKEIADGAKVLVGAFGEHKHPGTGGDVRSRALELSVKIWLEHKSHTGTWKEYDPDRLVCRPSVSDETWEQAVARQEGQPAA